MEHSIVIVNVAPILALAETDRLDLLLNSGRPVLYPDWAVADLLNSKHSLRARALAFLGIYSGRDALKEIRTGVPEHVVQFEALNIDPAEARQR